MSAESIVNSITKMYDDDKFAPNSKNADKLLKTAIAKIQKIPADQITDDVKVCEALCLSAKALLTYHATKKNVDAAFMNALKCLPASSPWSNEYLTDFFSLINDWKKTKPGLARYDFVDQTAALLTAYAESLADQKDFETASIFYAAVCEIYGEYAKYGDHDDQVGVHVFKGDVQAATLNYCLNKLELATTPFDAENCARILLSYLADLDTDQIRPLLSVNNGRHKQALLEQLIHGYERLMSLHPTDSLQYRFYANVHQYLTHPDVAYVPLETDAAINDLKNSLSFIINSANTLKLLDTLRQAQVLPEQYDALEARGHKRLKTIATDLAMLASDVKELNHNQTSERAEEATLLSNYLEVAKVNVNCFFAKHDKPKHVDHEKFRPAREKNSIGL